MESHEFVAQASKGMHPLAGNCDFAWHSYCWLHQAHHVEFAVTGVVSAGRELSNDLKLLSRMYSLAILLGSGGLFTRMRLGLPEVLPRQLEIHRGIGECDSRKYALELCKYALCHYNEFATGRLSSANTRSKHSSRHIFAEQDDVDAHNLKSALRCLERINGSDDLPQHKGLKQFVLHLRDLLDLLPGPWWRPILGVRDYGGGGQQDVAILAKLRSCLLGTVFRCRPQVPASNKWSKLGPCLDVLITGLLIGRLFLSCFEKLSDVSRQGVCLAVSSKR